LQTPFRPAARRPPNVLIELSTRAVVKLGSSASPASAPAKGDNAIYLAERERFL
jgi:hypothetical protein